MLSLVQAVRQRGEAGIALPTIYPSLAEKQIHVHRSQLTLVIGTGGAGKSILTQNLVARWGLPTLAVLLDQDRLTAAARIVSTLTGDHFLTVKSRIDEYESYMWNNLEHVQACFKAESIEDIKLQLSAYQARYGEPPAVLLVDNLTNLSGGWDDEWAVLRALTLGLDEIARDLEMAVVACSHTSDWDRYEPPPRKMLLGKVSQFPRLILSVGFNPMTGEYKLAAVKNSSGESDLNAMNPLVFTCNPATMQLVEKNAAPGRNGFGGY